MGNFETTNGRTERLKSRLTDAPGHLLGLSQRHPEDSFGHRQEKTIGGVDKVN
jgi:hypothetical protein